MKIEEKILRSISMREGKIILRRDVSKFGSPSSVSKALSNLIDRGKIVRIGYGVYAKTKISSVTGNVIASGTLDELAVEFLNMVNADFDISKATKEYNEGLTTQIPAQISFGIKNKKISRELSLGEKSVYFEKLNYA